MPIVFGEPANSVVEIVTALKNHGDRLRGAYRSRYPYDRSGGNPYAAPSLERPAALSEEPASRIYPWEQIFVAAATCAGSDYPMLADHAGISLDRSSWWSRACSIRAASSKDLTDSKRRRSRPIADRVASAIKTREIHECIRERFAVRTRERRSVRCGRCASRTAFGRTLEAKRACLALARRGELANPSTPTARG